MTDLDLDGVYYLIVGKNGSDYFVLKYKDMPILFSTFDEANKFVHRHADSTPTKVTEVRVVGFRPNDEHFEEMEDHDVAQFLWDRPPPGTVKH